MNLLRVAASAFCAGIFFSVPAFAEIKTERIEVQGLTVNAWLPEHPEGKPVILYSHGFGGCASQGAFMLKALAEAGYAAFAPEHDDAACPDSAKHFHLFKEVSFDTPEKWNGESYLYRRKDMEVMLDNLPKDPRFAKLDWQHVGAAGHSLGGYAALGLGGGVEGWKDARIKAVLALSPSTRPLVAQHHVYKIDVPVMYQGGTNDPLVTPFVSEKGGAYDQTPAPKYLVIFKDSEHMSWADMATGPRDAFSHYAIAFFDKYLKAAPVSDVLTAQRNEVSEIRNNP